VVDLDDTGMDEEADMERSVDTILKLIAKARVEAAVAELELIAQIDFRDDMYDADEIPGQTLDEYVADRLNELREGAEHE
jgi:hypothetical protein